MAAEHLEAFLSRMNSLGLSISRVVRKLGNQPSLAQIFKHCVLECAHTPVLSAQDKDELHIQLKFVVHLLKDNPELERGPFLDELCSLHHDVFVHQRELI